jgi:hypothetical protein
MTRTDEPECVSVLSCSVGVDVRRALRSGLRRVALPGALCAAFLVLLARCVTSCGRELSKINLLSLLA